jgi:uncharacterized protein YkwD
LLGFLRSMRWALIAVLAVAFSAGAAPEDSPPPHKPHVVRTAAAPPVEYVPTYDNEAEQRLLTLANQARSQAGIPALQMDPALTQAARLHCAQMRVEQQLSHQFPGEPSLAERLAATGNQHLDQAGENVAYAGSVDRVEEILMNSPVHRENLLNAAYNVAGFGVVRNGDIFYVTQDFGHTLPTYSAADAEHLVSVAVDEMRAAQNLSALQRREGNDAEQAACGMAQANALKADAPRARYILRYTAALPAPLPAAAAHPISDRSLRSYAVGACFARTPSYPSGAYWILLLFY